MAFRWGNGFVPEGQADRSQARSALGFQPVSGFATGNTLEIMGMVAGLATT